MSVLRTVAAGLAAGAAGTTALNVITYLDMTWRGRPSSSTPEDSVDKLSQHVGLPIPGDDDTRQNRLQALGALSGQPAGVGIGGLLGTLRALGWAPGVVPAGLASGAAAMAATDGSMAALRVSDPRTWKPADWLADAVPRLVYGLVTAWVLQAVDPSRIPGGSSHRDA